MKSSRKKRLLALLLTAVLSGGLCTDMTVLASETEDTSGTNRTSGTFGENDALTWTVENGVLKISGNGKIEWGYNGGWENTSYQKIEIGEGITSIDTDVLIAHAAEISIPASVGSIRYCDSWTVDGEGTEHCSLFAFTGGIQKITVAPGNKTFTSVDGVLYNKDKSVMICFPNSREGAFTVPNGVTRLGSGEYAAFSGSKLTSITIPEGVTHTQSFRGCINLKNITLPASVKDIGDGFGGCTSLMSVTILNKTLALYDYHRIRKEATIYGYTGSTAEAYAQRNGNKFVALDNDKKDESGNKLPVKVTSIKLSGDSKKVAAGKKIRLTAKVAPSNAANKKLTWKSSNKKVATVSSTGVVTMKKGSGGKSVTITATAQDGSGKKASYKIKSMKGAVTSVKLSGKKTVKAGKSIKLKAAVKAQKNANKTLKWTSSNTKYAKVSKSGKVTSYKAGKGKTVTITAQAVDGTGKKAKLKIKIK